MTEVTKHEPTTIYIKPSLGLTALNLRDLWLYRELIFFMVWRDIKVRYKQTLLGAAWAIIQPVMTMLVFSLFFGRLAKMPSDGVPYPAFSLAGLVPWTFFAGALGLAANSLVSSANLIKKVYFPRIIVPVARVLSVAVDFALAFVILLVVMGYYGIWPSPRVLWVLPLFLLALVTSIGAGLWLSAL